jgi:hypothetical protein
MIARIIALLCLPVFAGSVNDWLWIELFLGGRNKFVANLIVACYLTKKLSSERGPVQMTTIIFSMSNPVAWMAGFRIRPNQRQWSHK